MTGFAPPRFVELCPDDTADLRSHREERRVLSLQRKAANAKAVRAARDAKWAKDKRFVKMTAGGFMCCTCYRRFARAQAVVLHCKAAHPE